MDSCEMERGSSKFAIALWNETIVFLLILAAIVCSFPALKNIQTGIEFFLLMYFVLSSFFYKFNKEEFVLIIVFWIVTVVSFFLNDLSVFLLNAKQFGLAIYTMLYFSRIHYYSRQIVIAAVVSLCSMVIYSFAPGLFSSLIALSRYDDFNLSRFGGLFLNAHYNAYFLAVLFIYLFYQRKLYYPASIAVYATGSKFVFVSYFFQGIPQRIYKKIMLLLCVVLILAIFYFSRWIVAFFNTPKLVSLSLILLQLLDLKNYYYLLSIFPNDYVATMNTIAPDSNMMNLLFQSYSNEIGYFTFFYQGGNVLAVIFLSRYLKLSKPFLIFILVSMFHYGFIISPLIVYMFMIFSWKIIKDKNKKNA